MTVGKCLKCGACCRHLIFKLKVSDEDSLEFYRARGFKVSGDFVDADVPHICPNLDQDTNLCRLHGVNKPLLCRVYPSYVIDGFNDGCGFNGV